MKALVLTPGTTDLRLADRPEPNLAGEEDVKLQVLQVGICGTDREEAAGGRARPPDGQTDLVVGHEMLGRVVAAGSAATRVAPGDLAVFTVRRGCGQCLPCAMGRSDMCRTGSFRERGIWGLDGYQAEYVVDRQDVVVRVPPELSSVGVLVEPLSVAEKAIDEAIRTQTARLPDAAATPDWLFGRRCLVAGLGPIGLLAALALRLRGAEVFGLDVVEPDTARPQWLTTIGGHYLDGRRAAPGTREGLDAPVDLILEATGVPALAFNLLDALGPDGVYVLTGIPGGDRPLQVPAAEVIRRLVLENQVMVGSVNAARDHYQQAVDDLACARLRWGDHVARLITHRRSVQEAAEALRRHEPDEIKVVVEWGRV